MTVDEIRDLKPRIISALKEEGFNVLDTGGTFDLYVDMDVGKGYFIELKVANTNYKAWADKSGKKGLNLTSQTSAIRTMKNLPIIFACDEDDMNSCCYLILPDELKRLIDERKEHEAVLIGVTHLKKKSYNAALNELIAYLRTISSP
jgi:hypothetical protein